MTRVIIEVEIKDSLVENTHIRGLGSKCFEIALMDLQEQTIEMSVIIELALAQLIFLAALTNASLNVGDFPVEAVRNR